MTKYILVTGGVISGIGKGIIASSTGLLLKTMGLKVTAIKIDPYLNIDAGTITPLDHGEVFVLDDGGEVDMDLGNYERFLDVTLSRDNNVTTGKIYREVIERERKGDYLGKTVQVVPHITNMIQDWIERVSKLPVDNSNMQPDVCIVELGGTVGDIESAPFVEAMRQFQFRVGHENFALIHVSLVPVVGSVGEQKTKPTQASVRDLRGLGLIPDVIACRSTKPLEDAVKEKLSMFCHVPPEQVLAVHDCSSIYHVPLLLEQQGLLKVLRKKLNIPEPIISDDCALFFSEWQRLARCYDENKGEVRIALIGKYSYLQDSYVSVVKALQHASLACHRKLILELIESSNLDAETRTQNPTLYEESWAVIRATNGIIVPGGFGYRGVEGIIDSSRFARENKIPYLGICLGLQASVIEFSRNVLRLEHASSTEFHSDTPHPVIVYMPEISKTHLGGTMRLGARVSRFVKPAKSRALYGDVEFIHERHRHRYEVNPSYVPQLEKHGMSFVAHDESKLRMEIMEYTDHPYYIAVQFHPELKSRPLKPSPLFLGLIQAASSRT